LIKENKFEQRCLTVILSRHFNSKCINSTIHNSDENKAVFF
jgi:hypothetical protein